MRYEYHYPGFTAGCHPLVTLKNGKGRLNFEKTSRRHPQATAEKCCSKERKQYLVISMNFRLQRIFNQRLKTVFILKIVEIVLNFELLKIGNCV